MFLNSIFYGIFEEIFSYPVFMSLFLYTFLFIFWTMFGSFASVLIYRIKSGEGWIVNGRSHCKTCERDLSALELIPILSWVFQWWKCKWCKQKISPIYPILEITTGLLFAAAWVFLIDYNLIFSGNIFEWSRMLFFCTVMFLTVIYVFYDILYLEIPESILLAANLITVWALILQWYGYSVIPYLPVWNLDILTLIMCLSILWALYLIMLAGLRELWDILILLLCIWALAAYFILYSTYQFYSWNEIWFSALLSWTIAWLVIFISFFLQIVLSWGRAMWWGDLRIAILMWLIAWVSLGFPAWMICYLIWSIIGIIIILKSKITHGLKAHFQHQIPFGPFIASWYLGVLLFSDQISKFIEWYL